MEDEFLIETPEPPLERIAKGYLLESGLDAQFKVVVKKEYGNFYFLNRICFNSLECLDYLNIDLSKNQFINRLQFWNRKKNNSSQDFFDPKILSHLTEQINFEWTQKILHSFIKTTEKQFPLLKSALQNNDISQLSKTAHYLKSSSLFVGAHGLHSFCEICLEKSKYNEPWTQHLFNQLLEIEFEINSTRRPF